MNRRRRGFISRIHRWYLTERLVQAHISRDNAKCSRAPVPVWHAFSVRRYVMGLMMIRTIGPVCGFLLPIPLYFSGVRASRNPKLLLRK